MIFHDTSWKGYIHKSNHPCAGKLTGNTAKGYDTYGGIDWETPDVAIKEYFDLGKLEDYEDDFILVEHNSRDLGMTFIKKKIHSDYSSNIKNWEYIYKRRQLLLNSFGSELI